MPSCGAWWGVAPGAHTDGSDTAHLAAFERAIQRPVDIYHAYHRGAEIFPTGEEVAIAREAGRNRLLLLNWKPDMGRTWAQIAAGDPEVDRHIDRLARHISENFPEPFFLTIHHEPENDVVAESGSGFTATDYRNMFRHVIARLRDRGVDNMVTVMNYMGSPKWGVKPWFTGLYPGDDMVDWIAFDPYAGPEDASFDELVNSRYPPYLDWPGFYRWVTDAHPDKPLMLAEWGALSDPDDPSHKPGIYRSLGERAPAYPDIKAYVYFDTANIPEGDTTVDSSEAALEAYRELGHMRYFDPPGPSYG